MSCSINISENYRNWRPGAAPGAPRIFLKAPISCGHKKRKGEGNRCSNEGTFSALADVAKRDEGPSIPPLRSEIISLVSTIILLELPNRVILRQVNSPDQGSETPRRTEFTIRLLSRAFFLKSFVGDWNYFRSGTGRVHRCAVDEAPWSFVNIVSSLLIGPSSDGLALKTAQYQSDLGPVEVGHRTH